MAAAKTGTRGAQASPRRARRGRPSAEEQARRGDAREIMLAATHDLMVEKNGIEVSVAEIAERTGQSPAMVQYHFGNKFGLLLAVLRVGTDRATEQMGALRRADMGAEAKLRAHVKGLLRAYFWAPYVNPLLRAVSEMAPSDEADPVLNEFVRPLVEFYEHLLAQGEAEGVFRPVRPMHLYLMLVGACDQLFARRRSLSTLFGVEAITDDLRRDYERFLVDLVLEGLRVRDAGASGG